jgi:hypothetical protein
LRAARRVELGRYETYSFGRLTLCNNTSIRGEDALHMLSFLLLATGGKSTMIITQRLDRSIHVLVK